MGRNPKHLLPQMRLHKGSGHARVRINGTEHWLGPFGSREALSACDRLIAQYLATRGARTTLVAEVPQALATHQQPDPLPVEEELPPNAPPSIADPQPATASTELTGAEPPNDLLRCELLPSRHLLLSRGLHHQRFSL